MSYHLVFFSKISRNFNSTFIQIVNNLESPLLLYIKLPSLAQYVYTKNILNWCTNLKFNHFIYCQILIFSYLQSLPCTPPLLFWFFARMHTLTPSVRSALFPTPEYGIYDVCFILSSVMETTWLAVHPDIKVSGHSLSYKSVGNILFWTSFSIEWLEETNLWQWKKDTFIFKIVSRNYYLLKLQNS